MVGNELKSLWKEPVVTYLRILCRHFLEGTEKSHEYPKMRAEDVQAEIRTGCHKLPLEPVRLSPCSPGEAAERHVSLPGYCRQRSHVHFKYQEPG
jgi:hypothetical protein